MDASYKSNLAHDINYIKPTKSQNQQHKQRKRHQKRNQKKLQYYEKHNNNFINVPFDIIRIIITYMVETDIWQHIKYSINEYDVFTFIKDNPSAYEHIKKSKTYNINILNCYSYQDENLQDYRNIYTAIMMQEYLDNIINE
jgi:hypothetical protein